MKILSSGDLFQYKVPQFWIMQINSHKTIIAEQSVKKTCNHPSHTHTHARSVMNLNCFSQSLVKIRQLPGVLPSDALPISEHRFLKYTDQAVRSLWGLQTRSCPWTCSRAHPRRHFPPNSPLFCWLNGSTGEGAEVSTALQVQHTRPPPGGTRERLGAAAGRWLLGRFRLAGT